MPDWLHRTNKALLKSIASADLPEPAANYIEQPDLSAVSGQPSKYWKITGDDVSLMSAGEQATVDAAEKQAQYDAEVAPLSDVDRLDRALTAALLEEINALYVKVGLPTKTVADIEAAARAKLGT